MGHNHAEIAHDYIYTQILNGSIAQGQPIIEMNIAEKLGMSRSPIREAIKRLDAEGIVTIYNNRGAFVKNITIQDIEDLFELRILFETASLKDAINRIDDAAIKKMEEDLRKVRIDSTFDEYHALNNVVHETIIKYGGNKHIRFFYEALNMQMKIVARISFSSPNHLSASSESHAAILDAIKERNLKKAQDLLREHLEEACRRTVVTYKESM